MARSGFMERVHYDVGDIVRMKKKHPCGSDEWRLTRVGMDFGMRCQGCDHFVMIPRVKFEKMCRAIVKKAEESASGEASQDRNTGKI